jgi:hypothetical protein
MDKLISVRFERVRAVVNFLTRAAKRAFFIIPSVFRRRKNDVALFIVKPRDNRIFAVCRFRAINAPPRKQRGQFGNGDAEKLSAENVIDSRLKVAISRRKTPDLQTGSRNLVSLFVKSSGGNKSKIRLASAGGVKTSSLLKFAKQVKTSGL